MTRIFIVHAEKYRDGETFDRVLSTIPASRREGVERMQSRNGKCLLLATGAALSAALASFGIDPAAADIRKTKAGKPYLYGRDDVFFSLSHTGQIGVCSISDSQNGVDAEQTGRANAAVASRFFTSRENRALAACGDYDYYFTRLWTLKESFSKYVGEGIAAMAKVEIDLRGSPRVVSSPYGCQPRFVELTYGEYQISLCTDDGDKTEIVEV